MPKLGSGVGIQAEGSGTEVRLIPATTVVRVGSEPFVVTVAVENVDHHFVSGGSDSEGLGVFQLALHVNPSVVSVTGMEAGPFMRGTGRSAPCFSQKREGDPSIFDFACISTSPPDAGPQGSGVLATLTLLPVGSGSSDLVLDGEMGGPSGLTGDDIVFKAIGATVTVVGPTDRLPETTVTPASSVQPGTTGVPHPGKTGVAQPGATGTAVPSGPGGLTPQGRATPTKSPVAGQPLDGPPTVGGSGHGRWTFGWKLALGGGIAAVTVLAVVGGALYRRQVSTAPADKSAPQRRVFRFRSGSDGERR